MNITRATAAASALAALTAIAGGAAAEPASAAPEKIGDYVRTETGRTATAHKGLTLFMCLTHFCPGKEFRV
jgi:hypothetical protein